MILKVPLSKIILIKKDDLDKDTILKNNSLKICTDCVDQYVVTENNKLYGLISSYDIEQEIKDKGDIDIDTLINKQPITIIQSERFEKKLAENIFSSTYQVKSIPIVNRKNEIQYIYRKININLQKFVKQNFMDSTIFYQKMIKKEILELERSYPKTKIHILSDFWTYGLNLNDLQEYVIQENEIDSLEPIKDLVLLVYLYDFNCMEAIGKLIEKGIKWIGSNYSKRDIINEVTPYFKMDEEAKEVLEEETYLNGNYFDLKDFENIFQAIRMTKELKGSYVEIGTYRGDSARAALSFMRKSKITKKAYFLDTYEGFSYTGARDSSDCAWADSHDDTSIDFVKSRLKEFTNYKLIKTNIITEDLPEEIGEIAVCNIDVDMYEAVDAALEKVYERVLSGGLIIAEDFGHTPALFGAHYAVHKFMETHKNNFYGIYLESGQYLMIKK